MTNDEHELTVERAGPLGGEPLVLVHAGVADARMWDAAWPLLTATCDVVRMDLRGFGSSVTRPDDGRLDHVADLIDVLDALDIGHAHVVGASLGAGVAMELALARPDVVSSLLLCPPGGSLLAELTPDLAAFFAAEREALAANDLDAAVEANVDSWLVGAGRIPADVEPAAIDLVRTMQRRAFEVTADWGDLDEVELEPPALERLDEVDCRVLVLVGGHDLDTTHDAARRVVAGVRNAILLEWPDVAHLPPIESPDAFARLVQAWVDGHDPVDLRDIA